MLDPQFAPTVYLEGVTKRGDTLSREHHGPRAVLNAVERLANGFTASCDSVKQDLAVAEGQRRDYQASLGKPFVHEAYLSNLTGLRDQLKAALSGEPKEGEPTASDIAEQIKALRAAQTIEATPERVGKRRTNAAEEPVTARIRRKAPAAAQLPQPGNPSQHASTIPSVSRTPSPPFQDRVATARQHSEYAAAGV